MYFHGFVYVLYHDLSFYELKKICHFNLSISLSDNRVNIIHQSVDEPVSLTQSITCIYLHELIQHPIDKNIKLYLLLFVI